MSDITKVDKNFIVNTDIKRDDMKLFNCEEAPFKIYGVFKEGDRFRRMPEEIAKKVSEGVYSLHSNTAGGRVKFMTNSSYIAIQTVMDKVGKMSHFPLAGSAGFDLYINNIYKKTFVPPFDITDGYAAIYETEDNEMKEVLINFPLYSDVKELYIGLREDAEVKEAPGYLNEKPVVTYGSSITQGGCASRSGMSYQGIFSRKLNCDYLNLGFSGSAKGEDEMAEYIRNLDMSVFVYDYDHNAANPQYLKNTHEKMFKTIREGHPDLPVIMMCRPKHILTGEECERREIIETTYKNALEKGDKNVYFIDGAELTSLCGNEGTVDNCHPTDFGFNSMAEAIYKVMKDIKWW